MILGRCRVVLALVLWAGFVLPAAGQQESLVACLSRAGATDTARFMIFDRELRSAVAAADPLPFVVLAKFPLAVFATDGSRSLNDPKTLAMHIRTVLTPKVRAAIANTNPDQLICRDDGIGYGDGALWVKVAREDGTERFEIATVNTGAIPEMRRSGIEYVCRTADTRLVVDSDPKGAVRLRLWNWPRTVGDRPDLELRNGHAAPEGTQSCAHETWSFKGKGQEYFLSTLGCSEGAPIDATGELVMTIKGSETRTWCY